MRFSIKFFGITLLFASTLVAQDAKPSIKVTFESTAPRPIPQQNGESRIASQGGPLDQFATVQFVEPSEVAAGLNSNRATFPIPRPQFDETAHIHAAARMQRETLAGCPQRPKCRQDISRCYDEWAGFCNPKRMDWECDCDPFPRPEKTIGGCGTGGCGFAGCGHSGCNSGNCGRGPGVLKVNISLGHRDEVAGQKSCQCQDRQTECDVERPGCSCRQVQPLQKVKAVASRVTQRCQCCECNCANQQNGTVILEEAPRPQFEDAPKCQCQSGCRCTPQNHCGCKN